MTTEAAAFPVTWENPADAQLCWRYDPVHMPQALSPIGFELNLSPFLQGFGWGMRPVQVNYYTYFAYDGPRQGERPPSPVDVAYLHESTRRTCKKLTGRDDLSALRLAQGYPDKSLEAGERLWRVGRVAASLPAVRDRLLKIDTASARDCFAELERDPEAQPFVAAFHAYLDEFGWRTGGEFSSATWFEDPTVPLTMLRAYLEMPDYDPAAEQRRLADDRDAAVRDTMAQLSPEERKRLEDVLAAVRGVVNLSEDHNYYIDQLLATTPRRLLLAAGRRLVSKDVLENPALVFFLHVPELIDALEGKAGSLQSTAARRKEELAHWRTVTPPPFLGAPPPESEAAGASQQPALSVDGRRGELRGTGASAGTARGPARVLTSLSQSERLRPGDVLVTPVTSPAWTPLFAIAGAIITEVGGMLSHTAVAAREYGLPAVVAVPDATRLIRDGELLEVDGSAGVVRVIA